MLITPQEEEEEEEEEVWFGSFVFNGISTFIDYLRPKLFLQNCRGTI